MCSYVVNELILLIFVCLMHFAYVLNTKDLLRFMCIMFYN